MRLSALLIFHFIISSLSAVAQHVENIHGASGLTTGVFEKNCGQIIDHQGIKQDDIRFTLRQRGVTVYFRKDGLSYQWNVHQNRLPDQQPISETTGLPLPASGAVPGSDEEVSSFRVDMTWENVNPTVCIQGLFPIDGVTNYYLSDLGSPIRNVVSYDKIVYQDIYPNINVEYYINDRGNLKYDLILGPGADPSQISCSYLGSDPILADGKVRINTPLGFVEEQVPEAWIAGSEDKKVEVKFRKLSKGIGYKMARHSQSVILDPEIIWATYYGGTGADAGYSTKIDDAGNVLMAGETNSSSAIAAAPGCITTKSSAVDAFVVKFSDDGATRIWATYYGGSGTEGARDMAIDASGNIYIVGSTNTNSGGLPNTVYQTSIGGTGLDAFLAKFDNDGGCLWATYYGFNNTQTGYAVAVDDAGDVYIAGYTDGVVVDIDNSPAGHDLSYSNPSFDYNPDAYLVKFSADGTTRLWATYYGGEYREEGHALFVDDQNNVYLGGSASSAFGDSQTDIATPGSYKFAKTGGDNDAFLVKFNASGARQWGTYFGGNGDDVISSINIDNAGNIYLGGSTYSTTGLGATSASYQEFKGGNQDAFVAKLNANGSELLWASYFGGANDDIGHSTTVDDAGHLFLCGRTNSSGLGSKGFQNNYSANYDAFVVMFDLAGNGVLWSSYYGGTNNDFGQSIIKDQSGIYMAGITASTGLSKDGFQSNYAAGGSDAFLTKIEVPEFVDTNFPQTAEKKGGTPVSATLNTVGNSTVKLWRKGISAAKGSWTSETLTPSGNVFSKALASTDLTDPIGLSYFFEITDASQVVYKSDTMRVHVHYGEGENSIPGLRFGSLVSDYQIMSVPLTLDDDKVTSVLDELQTYDRKRWRLFQYYDNDNREYNAFSSILPGLGYWLIIKSSTSLDPGAGRTVSADEDNPFVITLKTGWNLIGNPYDFRISWQDVRDYNNNPPGIGNLKTISGEELIETDVLDRYRGAFVFVDSNIDIGIPVLRNTTLGGRKGESTRTRNAIDEGQWDVPLYLRRENLVNKLGGIGMHPDARIKGKDAFDEVNFPLLENMGFFELQVDHPEVHATFSRDIIPTMQEYTWKVDIRRDESTPLEVQWDNSTFGANDRQLYLLNTVTHQFVNMRDETKMHVGEESKQLLVIFGSQTYVDAVLDSRLPTLGKPYPVPSVRDVKIPLRIPGESGTQHVRIDVFDTTGKLVETLLDGDIESGQYTVEWKSDRAGLYILQMRSGSQTLSRKLIIH
jgi:hypothetical protein